MRQRISLAVVLVMFLGNLGFCADKADKIAARNKALAEADEKAFEANMAAYEKDVLPFLHKHCIACHGPKKLSGDLALDLLDADMKESASGARWAVVREYLEKGEMPPKEQPRPSKTDVEKVLSWIKEEMKRARRNFTRRLQFVHGNHVPHELLFDEKHFAKLAVDPRIRRLSPQLYDTVRKTQAKGFENLVSNPFTPDPRFLFKDMGTPKLDVPTTSQLLRNALTIVTRQTAFTIEGGKIMIGRGGKKEFVSLFDESNPLDDERMEKAVTMQFQKTLGRSPKKDELARFVALMKKNVKDAGRVAGVRYTLAAVFLIPDAIFRWEVGTEPDSTGRARLTRKEIADAIAYAISDQRPPAWLSNEASQGALDNAEGVAKAVEKMLKDPKVRKPRILRFFHEFFEYNKATEVFKDPGDFRSHKAQTLVTDTDNLVRWILDRDKDVLKELLTTNRSFVNTRYDSNKRQVVFAEGNTPIHLSYSLPPDWKWTNEQPIEMPAGTRAGILTQPSWLVAWSMNKDNHAILRGKWVRERLLGQVVPDIPITVDAQLPQDPDKTLRERMEVTRQEYCWQCHKLMNPVGLPFETYDHFGRYRATELARPLNAKGRIDLTGDKRLETEVDGAIEFVRKLAASERVEQVFVRHAFRYFTGRNENLGDGPSLRQAHRAYKESGGSFQALVTSIVASDSFLYRTPQKTMATRE